MNIIIWNARGLGNPRAFRELGRLVAEKCPTLLFLSETKMKEGNCRWWKHRLGFSGCFMVDSRGKSGGLALLWKEPARVIIKSFSPGHIDSIVQDSELVWRFTGFYGHPDASLRHLSWDLLHRLKVMSEFRDVPWLVGGDFNETCFDSEKLGGIRRAPTRMQAFRDILELCELQDLHCTGEFFTWVNRRDSSHAIFERLDRFVGNLGWRMMFPTARVTSLEFYHSDHRPVLLTLGGTQDHNRRGRRTQDSIFRFERCWLLDEECTEVVERGWGLQDQPRTLGERISSCKAALIQWNQSRFRRIPKLLKSKRELLNSLKTSSQWLRRGECIKSLEGEVEKLATQEEIYWRQRSRVIWLKEGDRNTRYFHSRATQRKNLNTMAGLVSNHGDWCTDPREIATIVVDYYESLFASSNPTAEDMDRVLSVIEPKVDAQMNQYLCHPFTATEVHRALFDMHPDKAPGPDGMSTLFYQRFWHVVGGAVTTAVLQVLNEGAPLKDWNETLVTLIPKVKDPMLLKDFRPINLCNVCYKIVARALTNRFRPVLSKLIEDTQSAFIPGRLITDNIIVGFEILHWMRNRRNGRSGYAALKLDMSKAYDRVEWGFLLALLGQLGFDIRWINQIMNCVSSVSYSFRVKEVAGPIKPSRGLRQGDPLSPYLFVLCAQGLSALLKSYEARDLFKGAKIASTCPSISHLFFADDSLVFFKASMEEGARVKECLNTYERASGQLINYDKSALSFSPNTNTMLRETLKTILTIPVVQCHNLYLGLPAVSMRSKKLQFQYLVEKVVKRIQGWGNRWFSTGGKEVLIKSVLQAIPSFSMSCFKIPALVCDEIESACASFWWGVENGKRKMHWRTWNFLCQPKRRGGLGFRNLVEFNRSLLAKQLWRLIQSPDSLASRVLKGRYFRYGSVLEAGLGSNPSYIWRSLLWSKDLLTSGLIWRVGDGHSINIFTDKWIPSIQSTIEPPREPWVREVTVSALIKDGAWDAELICASFNPYVAGEILKVPLPRSDMRDSLFWRFDPKGKYSVRDGCRLQRGLYSVLEHQSMPSNEKWWAFLWSLSLPPKVRHFWWSISHDCFATNLNLARHHVPVNEACDLCKFSYDSTCHSLFYCAYIKHLWKNTAFAYLLRAGQWACTMDLCLWMKEQLSKEEFETFATHAWAVWKVKQNFMHGDRRGSIIMDVGWSSTFLADFRKAKESGNLCMKNERGVSEKSWAPPIVSTLKLNIDAAVNSELNQFSIGGAVRDKQGRLLMAFGKQINQPISVVHGELLAIREGVSLLYEMNFRDVQVATDSLLAVQAVTTDKENHGYTGACAAEIRPMLKQPVVSEIVHVRREANIVAHNIAHFAYSFPSSFVWVNGEFPSWLGRLVLDDLK